MTDSLAFLAGTKPTNYFHVARANAAKILALETQLGLTPGAPIFNLTKAKARIADLQNMIAVSANKPAASEADTQLAAAVRQLTVERAAYPVAAPQAVAPVVSVLRRGRERFLASVKVEQTAPVAIDPNLKGKARFAASFKTI